MSDVHITPYSNLWQSNISEKEKEKFARNVDKRGPDECWTWKLATSRGGYGHVKIMGGTAKTHRVAWVIHNGPIPSGLKVCHKCDNPPCCNPSHLFLGTSKDNNSDRDSKGRGCVGDRHWSRASPQKLKRGTGHPDSKMTESDVLRIRDLHADGTLNLSAEGRRIGCSHVAVRAVAMRRTWKHIP